MRWCLRPYSMNYIILEQMETVLSRTSGNSSRGTITQCGIVLVRHPRDGTGSVLFRCVVCVLSVCCGVFVYSDLFYLFYWLCHSFFRLVLVDPRNGEFPTSLAHPHSLWVGNSASW